MTNNDNKNCPYLEQCSFFNGVVLPDFVKETLKSRYCIGNFGICIRKKMKDRGEKPPDNMVPDGRIIASKNSNQD